MNNLNNSLLDLPTPTSISTLWNLGFLLGWALATQIITGLILSITYTADVSSAFSAVTAIIQDTNIGWATRLIHMNGASLFFVLIYLHLGRGIYFSSPSNQTAVWLSGVAILLVSMATAFLGYVLPWGQISFWGATVITGVITAIPVIGDTLVTWVWGGPSVSEPTLNRFFSLHFLLPMLILTLVTTHLIFLHSNGSSNPLGTPFSIDNVNFNPLFTVNDFVVLILVTLSLISFITLIPYTLSEAENFNTANPLAAPNHIQPEWYFLFANAILRAVPSNLGGVLALLASILILTILSHNNSCVANFTPSRNINFWYLVAIVLILTWIGANTTAHPYEEIGNIFTSAYFTSILIL